MATPTRLTHGLSTVNKQNLFGDFPLPHPLHTAASPLKSIYLHADDCLDAIAAADITITGALSTYTPEQGKGGFHVLTPGGAAVASVVYRNQSPYQFVSGDSLWFTRRVVPGLFATTGTYAFGLQFGAAVTDGIWFTKPASVNTINLVSAVGNVATTLVTGVATHTVGSLAAGATTLGSTTVTCTSTAGVVAGQFIYGTGIPVNATVVSVVNATTLTISTPATATGAALTLTYASAVDLGFYYNGTDLLVYSNDVLVARVNSPTIGSTGTTLTNVMLNTFISCTPTATDLLHTDYLMVAQETTR